MVHERTFVLKTFQCLNSTLMKFIFCCAYLVIVHHLFLLTSSILNVNDEISLLKYETYSSNKFHESQNPYFVLHVGPQKTATTTIQCGLQSLAKPLKLMDNLYYIGKQCSVGRRTGKLLDNNETAVAGQYIAMELEVSYFNGGNITDLRSRLRHHHILGNNMAMSVERFWMVKHESAFEVMQDIFRDWNTHIVVTYRHYFEWLISHIYQSSRGKEFRSWPHEGGQHRPSILAEIQDDLGRWEEQNDMMQHPSINEFKLFSRYFDNVFIFDLHQDGEENLAQNFVCQMLPMASNTCNHLERKGKDKQSNEERKFRVSSLTLAEQLAENIYKEGYFRKSISSKTEIVQTIDSRLKDEADISRLLICISDEQVYQMMEISLKCEEELRSLNMPSFPLFDEWKERHIKAFNNAISSKKFCEIDVNVILVDKEWLRFLSVL